jgi:hypothetical protein
MFKKPATDSISATDRDVILLRSPQTSVENLVHGWDAIAAALKESSRTMDGGDREKVAKNIAYAERRAACVGSLNASNVGIELESLHRAIGEAKRFY